MRKGKSLRRGGTKPRFEFKTVAQCSKPRSLWRYHGREGEWGSRVRRRMGFLEGKGWKGIKRRGIRYRWRRGFGAVVHYGPGRDVSGRDDQQKCNVFFTNTRHPSGASPAAPRVCLVSSGFKTVVADGSQTARKPAHGNAQ